MARISLRRAVYLVLLLSLVFAVSITLGCSKEIEGKIEAKKAEKVSLQREETELKNVLSQQRKAESTENEAARLENLAKSKKAENEQVKYDAGSPTMGLR